MLKKGKKMNRQMKGSALVAVLLVMLMISAIAIAIINRTTKNLNMSIETKKSHSAYQSADQRAEAILSEFAKLDEENDTVGSLNYMGNETIKYFCDRVHIDYTGNSAPNDYENNPDYICNKWVIKFTDNKESPTVFGYEEYLEKVLRIEVNSGDNNSVQRAVSVPLPPRMPALPIALDNIKNCAEGVAKGDECKDVVFGGNGKGGISKNIANFKINWNSANNISDAEGYIFKVMDDSPEWVSVSSPTLNSGVIVSSAPTGTNYNTFKKKKISFTSKVKNEKNFFLDSLEYTPFVETIATIDQYADGQAVFDCDTNNATPGWNNLECKGKEDEGYINGRNLKLYTGGLYYCPLSGNGKPRDCYGTTTPYP